MSESSYVTEEESKKAIKDAVNPLNKLLWAVISILIAGFVVLLVTVAAMVMDTFQTRTDATNDLRRSIDYLNQNIQKVIPVDEVISSAPSK